ncbi:hypothetical protein HYH02_015191 [Chlamydomonas schloesseri]|uniref:Uncharacterized protein n=1 Tax=Chlamydomonas schloesseri TaxID=2026947 RepID=A0A835VT14_9CHLO|nr:hypothetical protein HYH02_015191 [Chlamydomonas schloesseri]|eukprot:KAG2424301.1 hypothetical protein HYH02_015191 [Chlamydomonas schloesseri]
MRKSSAGAAATATATTPAAADGEAGGAAGGRGAGTAPGTASGASGGAEDSQQQHQAPPPVPQQDPAERAAMNGAKERGNKLFSSQLYGEAAAAYTEALRLARQPEDVATLLSNRSAAYASLSRMYRSRPARRSECAALFDLDPTSLAQMALKDADRAVSLRPDWSKAYSRQGTALFLLERYVQSRDAFLEGLALEPTSAPLQEGLREVQAVLLGDEADGDGDGDGDGDTAGGGGGGLGATSAAAGAAAAAGAPSPAARAAGAAAAAAGGGAVTAKRQRSLGAGAGRSELDDWDCCLCAKLLFEPVTTPCGHTFCKECFARAIDHKPRCPYCRAVLHVARDALPVTITLANIISRAFPQEYEERRKEASGADADAALNRTSTGGAAAGAAATSPVGSPGAGAGAQPGGAGGGGGAAAAPAQLTLPLFVMSLIMPGETMALNIFEPRYRLMVRRVMEGSRRLGMAQARRDAQEIEDVAVEAEILECNPQPDGRYYLELVGRRRLKLVSHGELDGYRLARCELLADAPAADPVAVDALAAQVERQVDALLTQLRPLAAGGGRLAGRLRALLEGVGDRPPRQQAEKFSLWAATLASNLCPDLDKAPLLRLTDTRERLRLVERALGARMAAAAGPGGQPCVVM